MQNPRQVSHSVYSVPLTREFIPFREDFQSANSMSSWVPATFSTQAVSSARRNPLCSRRFLLFNLNGRSCRTEDITRAIRFSVPALLLRGIRGLYGLFGPRFRSGIASSLSGRPLEGRVHHAGRAGLVGLDMLAPRNDARPDHDEDDASPAGAADLFSQDIPRGDRRDHKA